MQKKKIKDDKLASILKEFAALDANKIVEINEHPDGFVAGLKEIGANTAKHIVAWELFIKASAGNLNAIKLFLEQIGESNEKTTEDVVTNLQTEDLQKMPLSKLKLLERQSNQKKNLL